jgi:pyruvate dehydrogenase E1 component beta subunit
MASKTMREAISEALWEEMERDPKVFIMGEEVYVVRTFGTEGAVC